MVCFQLTLAVWKVSFLFSFFSLFVPSEQKSSVELDQLDQVYINSKDDVSI